MYGPHQALANQIARVERDIRILQQTTSELRHAITELQRDNQAHEAIKKAIWQIGDDIEALENWKNATIARTEKEEIFA